MTTETLLAGGLSASETAQEKRRRWTMFAATHLAALTMLLNVISVPVVAYIIRNLEAEEFGQWATATALVGAVGILTNLGLRGTFVRAVAQDPDSAGQLLAEQFGIRLVLSVLATLVVMAACVLLKYPSVILECAAIACVGIFFTTIASTLSDLLQGLHRMGAYANANFIAGLTLTAASVLTIWLKFGPVALSVAYLCGPIVSAAILFVFVQRKLFPIKAQWSPHKFRYLMHNGRFFAVQQIVNAMSGNQESLLLPKLIGTYTFGLFSGGLLLASRLLVIPDSLGSALYPVIAHSYASDPRAASRDVARFFIQALILCLPVAVGVSLCSNAVAHLLFKSNAEICQSVIAITIWVLPLLGIECVMCYGLNAAGKDQAHARVTFYSATTTLLIAVILISQFGIRGACISFLLRPVLKIAMVSDLFITTFKPSIPFSKFFRVALCALAMSTAILAMKRWMPHADLMNQYPIGAKGWAAMLGVLAIQAVVSLACYLGTMFALRLVDFGDLMLLLRRAGASEEA